MEIISDLRKKVQKMSLSLFFSILIPIFVIFNIPLPSQTFLWTISVQILRIQRL
jgi:hypothetical protein